MMKMKHIFSKHFILIICLCFSAILGAQNDQNQQKGIAVKGYDVVAYFSKNATKGNTTYQLKYKDLIYRFSSETNKNLFHSNPSKYVPEYGGWCAYAMGKDGSKVDIDPETYEIRNGKLHLFYNKFGTNTLDLWIHEGADKLKANADLNWKQLSKK